MPARDPDEIRQDIEKTREELVRSLATLRATVTEVTDWKHYMRRRPLACLGGAFAVGFLVGAR